MQFEYPSASQALPGLANAILAEPGDINSRGGRVKELLYPQITLTKPWQREILTRKVNVAAQIAETMWVLKGRNDIEWLGRYLPRAKDFSDDGKTWRAGYGPRLRQWQLKESGGLYYTDQLNAVYHKLKREPTTRQAVISLWDPITDQDTSTKDTPCNNWLHFLNRQGALDLHVVIRSNDLIWGWSGINAFEWSAVQEIMASLLGLSVGKLVFSISSLHVYEKHWRRAEKIGAGLDSVGLTYTDSPRFEETSWSGFQNLVNDWFRVEELVRTQPSRGEAEVAAFPDPMLRSWLQVLQYYWSGGDISYLALETRLAAAARNIPQSVMPKPRLVPEQIEAEVTQESFQEYVAALHAEKDEAYGNSWIKRGEMLGVMANIARKVDRLGVSGAGDTAADTAIDLLCYLVKYRVYLNTGLTNGGDHVYQFNRWFGSLWGTEIPWKTPGAVLEGRLTSDFETLEHAVRTTGNGAVLSTLDIMAANALALARRLWWQENNEKRVWGGYGE